MQGFAIFATLGVDDQGMIVTNDVQKTIHMIHRLGAIVTFIYLAWLAVKAMNLDKRLRNTSTSLLVFLLLQAGVGVAAVLTELPLLLVTIHNAIAAMLLLAVVNLNHLLTPTGNPAQP
jgi:cytochrome c oxidase assembly protein subunit 15